MKNFYNKIKKIIHDIKKSIKEWLYQINIKWEENKNLKQKKKDAKTVILFNNSPISNTKEDVFDFNND